MIGLAYVQNVINNMMETVKLTPNEWQILQAIRSMESLDHIIITKKSPKSEQDFEMTTQKVSFFFKIQK